MEWPLVKQAEAWAEDARSDAEQVSHASLRHGNRRCEILRAYVDPMVRAC